MSTVRTLGRVPCLLDDELIGPALPLSAWRVKIPN